MLFYFYWSRSMATGTKMMCFTPATQYPSGRHKHTFNMFICGFLPPRKYFLFYKNVLCVSEYACVCVCNEASAWDVKMRVCAAVSYKPVGHVLLISASLWVDGGHGQSHCDIYSSWKHAAVSGSPWLSQNRAGQQKSRKWIETQWYEYHLGGVWFC